MTCVALTNSTVLQTRKARVYHAASGSSTATRTPTSAWRPSSTACVPGSVRLAAIHSLTCSHRPTLASFSAFLRERLPRGSLTDKRAAELYERYGPGKFNLNDQGYVARAPAGAMATRLSAEAAAGDLRRGGRGQRRRAQRRSTAGCSSRGTRTPATSASASCWRWRPSSTCTSNGRNSAIPSITWCRPTPPPWAARRPPGGAGRTDGDHRQRWRAHADPAPGHLDFALGSPTRRAFARKPPSASWVMTSEVAATLRSALSQVVDAAPRGAAAPSAVRTARHW